MRKVTYGGACSLDGFITGRGESIDWLRMSDDVTAIMAASWQGVDAVLMGRKTWEFAVRMGGGPVMTGVTSYVFSGTLDDVPDGVELVRDDAAEFVRELKKRDGGGMIVMGGGELATALIAAGLVDEIGLSVHPLLLGGGTPLLRELSDRVELELIEARAIAKACVLLRYRVVH